MKKLAFIGAGGHSDAVLLFLNKSKYELIGYFDDKDIKSYNDYPIIGKISDVKKELSNQKIDNIFITIGDNDKRKEIYDDLKDYKEKFINIISPNAFIANDATIGSYNNFISNGAFIGSKAQIGNNCIINTSSILEHHCNVKSHCNLSPGATLNGTITLEENVYIGSNATVRQMLKINSNVFIGAGAVVVKNIEHPGTYIGVPAKKKD